MFPAGIIYRVVDNRFAFITNDYYYWKVPPFELCLYFWYLLPFFLFILIAFASYSLMFSAVISSRSTKTILLFAKKKMEEILHDTGIRYAKWRLFINLRALINGSIRLSFCHDAHDCIRTKIWNWAVNLRMILWEYKIKKPFEMGCGSNQECLAHYLLASNRHPSKISYFREW